jgi:hypothetical protein
VDLGGHGRGPVTVKADWLETEFVCIPLVVESRPRDLLSPARLLVAASVSGYFSIAMLCSYVSLFFLSSALKAAESIPGWD